MKKIILWLILGFSCSFAGYSLLSADSTVGAGSTSTGTISPGMCTQEWAPVCGQPKIQECAKGMACAQILSAPKTFANTCMLKADGAELLYTGECREATTVCLELIIPKPKDGCTISTYTDDNGCKKTKQTCEQNVCSTEKNIVCGGKELCTVSTDGTTPPDGGCTTIQKTFLNKCVMNNAQYKFISYGECKVPDTTCPAITTPVPPDGCYYTKEKNEKGCYLPKLVCKPTEPICPAITTPVPPDGCFYKKEKNTDGCYIPKLICKEEPKTCPVYQMPLVKDGCKVKTQKDENGCDVPKIICKEEPKPIDGLKRKLEEALTRLFKRLDNSGMSNTDKITKLQGVVEKLKALIDAKPQYTDLLNFAIDKINAQIALYQNDGGDILNILQ